MSDFEDDEVNLEDIEEFNEEDSALSEVESEGSAAADGSDNSDGEIEDTERPDDLEDVASAADKEKHDDDAAASVMSDANGRYRTPVVMAKAVKPKIDTVLRQSNKARYVHIVHPDKRMTDNRLHSSEAAQIIALRAEQIAQTNVTFVDNEETKYADPISLAVAEIYQRRTPLLLRRQVGTNELGEPIFEEWDINTMVLPAIPMPQTQINI